jgi:hypothetical protein
MMKKVIFAALLAAFGGQALAGSGQGTIAKIESGPQYGDKVFITIEGAVGDQPACRSAGNFHFVFDSTAAGGKNLLATILLAKANKQNVTVSGTNACALYMGVEDLRWVRLD